VTVILVRGTGDIGSAIAALLSRAGYRVVLHDCPRPAHTRRGMAFVDALYDGTVEFEGLRAKKAPSLTALSFMLECRRAIPVVDASVQEVVEALQPQVVIDARMRKHEAPESQRGLAALTIGLGPNFEAGTHVDVAVETAWGAELGKVIRVGKARPLAGEPTAIAGHARDRYVYAPTAGLFSTACDVGERVVEGQELARIGDVPICAPLSGLLRGITHDGAPVQRGTKVVEVDPRDGAPDGRRLAERPRRIAQSVLSAVRQTLP
jgi:xanthine dehydrogenase accessory factor